SSKLLKQLLCFGQLGKQLLLFLKSAGMHTTQDSVQADWMFEMKHLVIHQVIDRILRHRGSVEDSADNDGVVRRIVMAEALTRCMPAPRHQGPGEQTVKETQI